VAACTAFAFLLSDGATSEGASMHDSRAQIAQCKRPSTSCMHRTGGDGICLLLGGYLGGRSDSFSIYPFLKLDLQFTRSTQGLNTELLRVSASVQLSAGKSDGIPGSRALHWRPLDLPSSFVNAVLPPAQVTYHLCPA